MYKRQGLDTPTSGSVIVRGEELAKKNDDELTIFRLRNIGFIFQNYNLGPILNVYENIVLPVELDGDTVDQKMCIRDRFAVRLKRMATHISKRFMVWGINGQEAKSNESE